MEAITVRVAAEPNGNGESCVRRRGRRGGFTAAVRSAAFTLVVGLLLSLLGACAHTMVIETEPAGATVFVGDRRMGEAPVVTQQLTGTEGRIPVRVEAENYDPATVVVKQTEWFLWPALIAVTPFLAIPFVVIPFVGPVITVGWALVTSPTLMSLFFLQRYPERVKVRLKPQFQNGVVAPTDGWLVPPDYSPNPPPLPPPPDTTDALPLEQPRQPEGGNPVP